jgi:tetratricopeptide (TPR) repeat protein
MGFNKMKNGRQLSHHERPEAMSADAVRPKVVLLIAGAFLLLVVLQVWMGGEKPGDVEEAGPQLSRLELPEEGEELELTREMTPAELEDLTESRIYLLGNGEINERRATAIQIAMMVADPLESDRYLRMPDPLKARLREALFRGLNDGDDVVSSKCREALLGIWRTSDSVAATERFQEGLAAWDAGRLEEALEVFQSVEQLRGSVPPDLYRMKAEVYLARSRLQEALESCRQALNVEPRNFQALLVVARIHARSGDEERAMKTLDTALGIYSRFPAARQLRRDIASRGDAG